MAKLIFYPVGNADSTLIHLADNRLILKDYCDAHSGNEDDKRIELDKELRSYLEEQERDYFDVVAFSHADDDHVHGADGFFWLDHAQTYQSDNRIHVRELWVPACFILETDLTDAARTIRQEAKHRLKEGYGIKVFGEPEKLDKWLEGADIDPADRASLIIRAGGCVPGFDNQNGQVEVFIHSPFSFRMEDEKVDRNGNSLVFHLTFFEHQKEYRCILGGDAEYETWDNIVYITKKQGNEERLNWDLFRISHHCSYTALADERGDDETQPIENIASLFDLGSENCILVSSSKPIPKKNSDEDADIQPPHRQAAKYYQRIAREHGNEDNFIVTMEWPNQDRPKPVIVETSRYGLILRKNISSMGSISSVTHKPSPRMG